MITTDMSTTEWISLLAHREQEKMQESLGQEHLIPAVLQISHIHVPLSLIHI